eukprot:jgi/Mesvir1/16104/Mv08394-RA.5
MSATSTPRDSASGTSGKAVPATLAKTKPPGESSLRVYPLAVDFGEAAVGQIRTAKITVKNISDRPVTVQITAPKGDAFQLRNAERRLKLSTGLVTEFEVVFNCKSDVDYAQYILIDTETEQVRIPLTAHGPMGDLVAEGSLDFGVVILERPEARTLSLVNRGRKAVGFKVRTDHEVPIKVSPSDGSVPARSSDGSPGVVSVTFEITPMDVGEYLSVVDIEMSDGDGVVLPLPSLRKELRAKLVQQSVELLTYEPTQRHLEKVPPLRSLNFGAIYWNDVSSHKALLVNRGPEPVAFRSRWGHGAPYLGEPDAGGGGLTDGSGGASRLSMYTLDSSSDEEDNNHGGRSSSVGSVQQGKSHDPSHHVELSPPSGVLEPNSSLVVTMTFHPSRPPLHQGFRSKLGELATKDDQLFSFNMHLYFQPAQPPKATLTRAPPPMPRLIVPVVGKATRAAISVRPPALLFGNVAVHDHADAAISIINLSAEVPVTFALKGHSASFSLAPPQGHLAPNESLSASASFHPKVLGPHKETLTLEVRRTKDGPVVFEESIDVGGAAGGIGEKKGPPAGTLRRGEQGDFTPSPKFVDPEAFAPADLLAATGTKGNFARKPLWEQDAALSASMVAHGSNKVGPGAPAYDVNEHTLSAEELKRRAAHKGGYADFLKTSRKEREAASTEGQKKKAARDPPDDAINLGLAHASGLRSPRLTLPRGDEPLWMVDPKSPEADKGKHAGAAGVRPRNRPSMLDDDDSPLGANADALREGGDGQATGALAAVASGGKLRCVNGRIIYRATPSNAQEAKECAAKLGPEDLLQIAAGPRELDFGDITAMALARRVFAVTNDSARAILVALQLEGDPEIDPSSGPPVQVIPPGATAGFDIVLCSGNVNTTVTKTIAYTINGQGMSGGAGGRAVSSKTAPAVTPFTFTASAHVVPVTLNVKPAQLNFQFDARNWEPTVTETVVVTNPNSHAASFSWEVSHPAFRVEPASGSIPRKGVMTVAVTWDPALSAGTGNAQGIITLKVLGGIGGGKQVICQGEALEGRLSLKDKRLDFGIIPACTSVVRGVSLRNQGTSDAVYRVGAPTTRVDKKGAAAADGGATSPLARPTSPAPPLPPLNIRDVILAPADDKGRVPAGGAWELEVSLTCLKPGTLDALMPISVRGTAKPLLLPVTAEVIIPDVSLMQDEVVIEPIYLGGCVRHPLALRNASPIPAVLLMDLSTKPGFSLECPREMWPPTAPGAASGEAFVESPVQDLLPVRSPAPGVDGLDDSGAWGGDGAGGPAGAPDGKRYQITVLPNSTQSFVLVYRPRQVESLAFELPLRLAVSPAVLAFVTPHASPALAKAVVAEAMQPRILLSAASIDFGQRIVMKEKTKALPYMQTVTLSNNDPTGGPVAWRIDASCLTSDPLLKGGIFELDAAQGVMAKPGDTADVTISFVPKEAVHYEASLPVFLEGAGDKMYVSLEVKGLGRFPELHFSVHELVLPPVPLGVRSHGQFTVLNDGYDNLELAFKLPVDTEHIPLDICFPDGTMIGLAQDRVRVDVSFVAHKPTSLSSRLEFVDDNGNRFGLLVTAIADNCLLTTYPFVAHQMSHRGLIAQGACPPNGQVADSRRTTQNGATPEPESPLPLDKLVVATEGRPLGVVPTEVPDGFYAMPPLLTEDPVRVAELAVSPSLARFLNATTTRGPLTDLVADMLAAHGQPLVELVESLSGRSVPGKMSSVAKPAATGGAAARGDGSKRSRVSRLLAQYNGLLAMLRGAGALVNGVKAEYLLELEDIRRVVAAWEVAAARADEHNMQMRRQELAGGSAPQAGGSAGKAGKRGSAASAGGDKDGREGSGSGADAASKEKRKSSVAASEGPSGSSGKESGAGGDDAGEVGAGGALPEGMGAGMLAHWKQLTDRHVWAAYSQYAWHTLVAQVLRTLVLLRVTPKVFKTLPGVDHAMVAQIASAYPGMAAMMGAAGGKPGGNSSTTAGASSKDKDAGPNEAAGLSSSNLYSVSEGLLLRWIESHFRAIMTGYAHRVTNFDSDLADGLALYSCLAAHWPSLRAQFDKAVAKPANTAAKVAANAAVVVAAMQALDLPYPVTVEDLLVPNAREMLLFCLYLYHTLPQLVPKDTVPFSGRIGEVTTKAIELSNPTGRATTYSARIQGSADFRLEHSQVRLEPRSTTPFHVSCAPRSSGKPIEGRLTFVPKREGSAAGSILVFALSCTPLAHLPLRTVTLPSTRTYELVSGDMEVVNPFPGDCELTISYIHHVPHPNAPSAKGAEGKGNEATGGTPRKQGGQAKGGPAGKQKGVKPVPAGGVDSAVALADPGRGPAFSERPVRSQFPGSFGVDKRQLRMREDEVTKLAVSFLPFAPGYHCSHVVFTDAKFGQFVLAAEGEARLPATIGAPTKFLVDTRSAGGVEGGSGVGAAPNGAASVAQKLELSFQNPPLETAKRHFVERHPLAKLKEHLERVRGLSADPWLTGGDGGALAYTVECSNPHVAVPAEFHLRRADPNRHGHGHTSESSDPPSSKGKVKSPQKKHEGAHKKGKSDAGGHGAAAAVASDSKSRRTTVDEEEEELAHGSNALPLSVKGRAPGTYAGRVVLTSAFDVRVYEFELVVAALSSGATIELSCPARGRVQQDIPLVNSGTKPLSVTLRLQGPGASEFSGPPEVTVPPNSVQQYPLTFRPSDAGQVSAELVMSISATGESSTYALKGVGTEPLAEASVTITCPARTVTKHIFQVPNINGRHAGGSYLVHSGLPWVSGASTLEMPSGAASAPFELTLCPQRSGTFQGTLTFTMARPGHTAAEGAAASSGRYVWYAVEMSVPPPPAEATLQVASTVREEVAVEIQLVNPLEEAVAFDVEIEGSCLSGPTTFLLGARASRAYELSFLPLHAGADKGSVRFTSDKLGEFWYELDLRAQGCPPRALPQLVAEVGTRASYPITVENPLREAVTLRAYSSNTRNFNIVPPVITLPPHGHARATVEYTPSSLDDVEEGVVELSDAAAGKWEFLCTGCGSEPTVMPPTLVTSTISTSSFATLVFRNPFPYAASVTVSLEEDRSTGGGDGCFSLLLKRSRAVPLAPFGTLSIPISFTPQLMVEHRASVTVAMAASGGNKELCWRFPLSGISEAPPSGTVFRYECPAKARLEEVLEVCLAGVGGVRPGQETQYTHEVVVPPGQEGALRTALRVEPIDTIISDNNQLLRFKVIFEPKRMLLTTVDFVITRPGGGRWRFEVQLQATEPEMDGLLVLEAEVGKTEVAYIRLPPALPGTDPMPFGAFFTPESPVELAVSPAEGLLVPGAPTEVCVSFSPREYGRTLVGTLIVQVCHHLHAILCLGVATPCHRGRAPFVLVWMSETRQARWRTCV